MKSPKKIGITLRLTVAQDAMLEATRRRLGLSTRTAAAMMLTTLGSRAALGNAVAFEQLVGLLGGGRRSMARRSHQAEQR